MVNFSKAEEVKRWLDAIEPAARRREVAIAVATRAALRVTPLLGRELRRGKRTHDEILSTFILPPLRATALSWVAAKYPASSHALGAAAFAVAFDAFAHTEADDPAAHDAARATTAAFVTLEAADAIHLAVDAVFAAKDAAASATNNLLAVENILAVSNILSLGKDSDVVTAAASDAALIDSGRSAAELAGTPLWPNGAPDWASDAWRSFKSDLRAADQDWDVWTDWYEARLAGDTARPPNQALEVARATIPDENWKQGPAVVNAEIKRLIDEHEKGEQVIDHANANLATPDGRDQNKAAFAPILATRVALRALPLFARPSRIVGSQAIPILAVFRALAVAWASVRYPNFVSRQWCVGAGRRVGVAVRGSELDRHLARSAADAAFAAGSETSGAAAARAASAQTEAQHAMALAPDSAAQVAARLAITGDAEDVVAGVRPSQVAEVALWPGRNPPLFLLDRWNALKNSLEAAKEGWEVWIDWYEARLDGRVREQKVELAYVEFIRNVVDSATARVANAEIKRLIDEATRDPQQAPATWDFFISYAREDESLAREVADVLETAGYSAIAQFKDIPTGANFVAEMNRGLAQAGRFIALYSPDYQASEHCQAEWAAAYNADPSGAKRKLVPFLLKPTALTPLARQIVHRSLVGLTKRQRKKAILEAIAPARTPSRDEIKERLAEVASPQATIDTSERLDAGPNALFDRPFVDADLPELPSVQRSVAEALRESLPRNTPAIVGASLKCYRDHLLERGTQPIVRVLDDFSATLRAECEALDASDWKGPGLAELFKRFFANDALLRTHFPLKGEALFAELPIDEDKAAGAELSDPIVKVAAAMQVVAAEDKATAEIVKAVDGSAAFARDLASLPRPQTPPDPDSTRVTVKRRYVLGTIGFLVTIYGLIGTTASIYGIPAGQALLAAVADAIEKLMSFVL